jgi:hypothetical protein
MVRERVAEQRLAASVENACIIVGPIPRGRDFVVVRLATGRLIRRRIAGVS